MSTTAAELRSIRKGLDKLRAEVRALLEVRGETAQFGAVKRSVAAKMMGIGTTKLDELIAAGKVSTAEDERLVPLSEVRRYCAPKAKRQRRPSVGLRAMRKHVDTQGDEAIAEMKRALKAGGQ